MTTVTPGSGATLRSSTAEQQLVEAVLFLWKNELIAARNPLAKYSVKWTVSGTGGNFTGNYSIPASQAVQFGGGLLISATPYLSGVPYSAGSGGTYSAETAESAALERIQYLQQLEGIPVLNPGNRDFVTGTFDSNTGIYQGSFSIPVTIYIQEDGSINFVANPYLIDD